MTQGGKTTTSNTATLWLCDCICDR